MINRIKILFFTFFTLLFSSVFAQNEELSSLLHSAREEFAKENRQEPQSPDFQQIARWMERALELDPNHLQARYYLGTAYGYQHIPDGESIPFTTWNLTERVSEQFERIVQASPVYTGETIRLDPYAKITSAWGSVALRYLYQNHPDSARLAFMEGKNRGGFSDFCLAQGRKRLDRMHPNSLFFTWGDLDLFNTLYLQVIENYRTDITPISTGLLESKWYPDYLLECSGVRFGYSREQLHTLSYCMVSRKEWKRVLRTASGKKFKWEITPHYGRYLFRGERLELGVIEMNRFNREVYLMFTELIASEFLDNRIFALRINYNRRKPDLNECLSAVHDVADCLPYFNRNRKDDVTELNALLFNLRQIAWKLTEQKKSSRGTFLRRAVCDQILSAVPVACLDDELVDYFTLN